MPDLTNSNSQPTPGPNNLPSVWQLVIEDARARNEFGIAKYRTPLQPFNGRDALVDSYQEALDLCVYLRQEIEERKMASTIIVRLVKVIEDLRRSHGHDEVCRCTTCLEYRSATDGIRK